MLLSPTRTYFPVIKKIFENKIPLHGIIHCTGGGQTKVMKFANNVRIIKDNLFPLPPVFRLIRKESSAALKEMFEVYNMGHRMEIYCDPAVAPALMGIASSFNMDARIIGRVESAEGKELIIHNAGEQLRYCF
ncbi:MAG: hypothetical protein KatS3mg031_0713 [Chitinophagales bacterium]|nr:MAG: hypothetical protein KatS3mg031_0713 [Chitinophagales bacterium]